MVVGRIATPRMQPSCIDESVGDAGGLNKCGRCGVSDRNCKLFLFQLHVVPAAGYNQQCLPAVQVLYNSSGLEEENSL